MPIRAYPTGVPRSLSTAWSSSIGTGGRHQSETPVVIDWNRWSSSIGIAGRLQLDPVVAINRNRWSSSIGTGGRHRPVRASKPFTH
jgi:hypothetical protein